MATAPSPRSSESPPQQSSLRRVVTASMAGTVVEWYEFFLYATAATLVFNKIMFPPSEDPLTPDHRRVRHVRRGIRRPPARRHRVRPLR